MADSKMEGLVVKISGENRASFIIAIVLIIAFAIGMAVLAALYVLNRRKIMEAKSKLRKLEEELKRVDEEARLAQEQKKREQLEAKATKLRARIDAETKKIKDVDEKRSAFDEMLEKVRSWEDIRVTGP